MAVKKKTRRKKTSGPSVFKKVWDRFRHSKLGRVLILASLFCALIALFAWIADTNLSLFFLLCGILFLLAIVLAWFLYLVLRDGTKGPSTKARRKTKA